MHIFVFYIVIILPIFTNGFSSIYGVVQQKLDISSDTHVNYTIFKANFSNVRIAKFLFTADFLTNLQSDYYRLELEYPRNVSVFHINKQNPSTIKSLILQQNLTETPDQLLFYCLPSLIEVSTNIDYITNVDLDVDDIHKVTEKTKKRRFQSLRLQYPYNIRIDVTQNEQ